MYSRASKVVADGFQENLVPLPGYGMLGVQAVAESQQKQKEAKGFKGCFETAK